MENLQLSLLAIVLLLAANAFFVAAEFALVKVRAFQLDQLSPDVSAAARLSIRMHKNLDAYLAACQLGITMASLGLGWVGEPAVAAVLEPWLSKIGVTGPALHTVAFILGFLIFSSLHIIVGEQVPKTYAIRKPAPVTLALAYPLHAFYLMAFPLNWLLDRANASVLRLLGVEGGPHHDIITEDELSAIVDESEAHGELEHKTADIIRKAFLFDDQTVRQIMVPWLDVDKLRTSYSAIENQSIVLETQHSRFPALDAAGNVLGVLAAKDVMSAVMKAESNPWESISQHLRPPLVVPHSLLISSLLERMRSTRTHMSIVIDEHGTYIGIVTLEDLLEEIVGEIEDEWDTDEVDVPIEIDGSGWRASGQLSFEELKSTLDVSLENTPGITTLGGFIMSELERLPQEGDEIQAAGHDFLVMKMDGRRIRSVSITRRKGQRRPEVS